MESTQKCSQNENQMIDCLNPLDRSMTLSLGQCKTSIQTTHELQNATRDWDPFGHSQFCLNNSLLAAYTLTALMPKSNTSDLVYFMSLMEKSHTINVLHELENHALE
jgi:hypothetical protein